MSAPRLSSSSGGNRKQKAEVRGLEKGVGRIRRVASKY